MTTILTSWISSIRRLASLQPAPLPPSTSSTEVPSVPTIPPPLCSLQHRPPLQWLAHLVSSIFLQAPCWGELCDPLFVIGFASVQMIHVVTLVAWLSHSMYVCVLVFSFRCAHTSQLLTSPILFRLGFATVLGGGNLFIIG